MIIRYGEQKIDRGIFNILATKRFTVSTAAVWHSHPAKYQLNLPYVEQEVILSDNKTQQTGF